ncbi:MAG: hypothetical protein WC533_03110 [Candidatus Pacearchaeota archaeon]
MKKTRIFERTDTYNPNPKEDLLSELEARYSRFSFNPQEEEYITYDGNVVTVIRVTKTLNRTSLRVVDRLVCETQPSTGEIPCELMALLTRTGFKRVANK